MIQHQQNSLIAVAVAAGVLLAGNLIAGFRLVESRASARDARANLRTCQVMADQIGLLREQDMIASETNVSTEMLNAAILELISKVGIPERQITEINRVPSVAIPETEYLREDVVVSLAGITIRNAVEIMLQASESELGAVPTSLRIVPARSGARHPASGERWHVELMLTHLVFAATSKQGG